MRLPSGRRLRAPVPRSAAASFSAAVARCAFIFRLLKPMARIPPQQGGGSQAGGCADKKNPGRHRENITTAGVRSSVDTPNPIRPHRPAQDARGGLVIARFGGAGREAKHMPRRGQIRLFPEDWLHANWAGGDEKSGKNLCRRELAGDAEHRDRRFARLPDSAGGCGGLAPIGASAEEKGDRQSVWRAAL